jgi:hypothetical protein
MSLVQKFQDLEFKDKMFAGALTVMGTLASGNLVHLMDYNLAESNGAEVVVTESGFFEQLGDKLKDILTQTPDPVELDWNMTEDEKTVVAKILYFEALDSEGARPIVEVIKNRYLFDACNEASPVENIGCNPFFGGKRGLVGVAMNKKPRALYHEFTCIDKNPKYFTSDLDTNVKGLNMERFHAMRKVLDEELADTVDKTNGALWYQNPDYTNQKWEGTHAMSMVQNGCEYIEDHKSLNVPRGDDWKIEGNSECRVDYNLSLHFNGVTIGDHDFYTMRTKRKETVHKDSCKFVDGEYQINGSSKKWCAFR